MALLDAEIARIKAELGYNLLTTGAEPWIGITALFDQVVKPFLRPSVTTTSGTSITASTDGSYQPAALTVASATGFAQLARIVVDVDSRQETATIQSVVGLVVTCLLRGAHTGTYPVTLEEGESIVRDILRKIADVKAQMVTVFGQGTLRKVDDIEFYQYQTANGVSLFGELGSNLAFWRDELARALGIRNWAQGASSGSQRLAVY